MYPGPTEEVVLPMLSRKGGSGFFFTGTRPGMRRFQTHNIPKVVGGITPECTRRFMGGLSKAWFRVSSTQVAEMVKLLKTPSA